MHKNINKQRQITTTLDLYKLSYFWRQIAQAIMLTLATVSIALFLLLAGMRLTYPFELEWIEGGYMDHVHWVAEGNALYPEPSIAFIPFNKTPIFFIVSALVTHLTGISFVAPRFVSIVATLCSFILIFLLVRYRTNSISGGIVAAGLYAAAFRFTGAWMDLARPDSLCLCFILLAFWIAQRFSSSFIALLVSGICYLLAYYTKQIALPVILVIAGYNLLVFWRRAWLPWSITVLIGVGVFGLLDWASSGWFSFYTFDMIAYKQRVDDIWQFWQFLLADAWPLLLFSLLILLYALNETWQSISHNRNSTTNTVLLPPVWSYLALAGGLLISSWSVHLQVWTYANGLMPVMVGLCLMAGIAVGLIDISQRIQPRWIAMVLRVLIPGLVIWQFILLAYDPRAQLPTEQDQQTGEQFVAQLSTLNGEVLVVHHGFFSYLAGKTSYLHSSPFSDAASWGNEYPASADSDNLHRRAQVQQVWQQAITQQYFDWIIVDKNPETFLPYYVHAESLFVDNQDSFYPVTGASTRPATLLVRNPVVQGGTVHFANSQTNYLLGSGWSVRENWGRWTDTSPVTLKIALKQQDYILTLKTFPFCYPQFEQQRITVYWNDHSLGAYTYKDCDIRTINFGVPAEHITMASDEVRIEIANTTTPSEVGIAKDNRQLGLGVISLSLWQE